MNLKDYLSKTFFKQPENARWQADFDYWYDFLHCEIDFHIRSDLHGERHCGRVLLYALMLADKMALDDASKEILCQTAVFHDSKRLDDDFDIGHGRRSADYYQQYCKNKGLKFYQETYLTSAYHDIKDETGIREIAEQANDADNALFLYALFKDADALDRYRLGLDGLDQRFLRFDESKGLTAFSKNLVLATERTVPASIQELIKKLKV